MFYIKSVFVIMFKGDWYFCLSWGFGFMFVLKKVFLCFYDEVWGYIWF